MTTIRLNATPHPADKFHAQNSIRDIDFTSVAEYAVILPVNIEVQGNNYTVHRSDSAASRWALRLAKKNIGTLIIDKKGNIYNAARDKETKKYTLLPTDKALEDFVSL